MSNSAQVHWRTRFVGEQCRIVQARLQAVIPCRLTVQATAKNRYHQTPRLTMSFHCPLRGLQEPFARHSGTDYLYRVGKRLSPILNGTRIGSCPESTAPRGRPLISALSRQSNQFRAFESSYLHASPTNSVSRHPTPMRQPFFV